MNAVSIAQQQRQYNARELIGLLTEQRDQCVQLKSLVQNQRNSITANEPERLLELLGQRKVILDRLAALSAQLRPFQADWAEVRRQLEGESLTRVDALVAEVNTCLSGVLKTDEEDTKLLAARKSTVSREIGTMKTAKQVGSAYKATDSQASSHTEWSE